jgi:hypothetical protein
MLDRSQLRSISCAAESKVFAVKKTLVTNPRSAVRKALNGCPSRMLGGTDIETQLN